MADFGANARKIPQAFDALVQPSPYRAEDHGSPVALFSAINATGPRVRITSYAALTGSVDPVVPPPKVAMIKMRKITMPAPTLDVHGRPK